MLLKFFGACREVTGSSFLLKTSNAQILFDCGLFQGVNLAEERNFAPFLFDPSKISVLIICHAHLDHTGRIPKLYRDGFRGKIYSTAPTKELTRLVLDDSLKLMADEARRDNGHELLYRGEDVSGAMHLFECIGYEEEVEIAQNVKLTFKNAGHILGSAIAILETEGKKLVYSSDLGNSPSELLASPEIVEAADYVVCESTYGNRVHEDISKRQAKLNSVISQTIANKSVLLIPSFAIERTQELLHDIEHYCTEEKCELPTFYLDSPLAQKVTTVFEKYHEFLKTNLADDHIDVRGIFGLDRVKMTSSVEESKDIEFAPNPKIIIAGSGMVNGGRILHHLTNYIEDESSTLLFVGYVARGTLGRRIFDGDKNVRIFGKKYDVKLKIQAIGSYSAHADSNQLVAWLTNIKGVEKTFLVHGESDAAVALAASIKEKLKIECDIPQLGEEYNI